MLEWFLEKLNITYLRAYSQLSLNRTTLKTLENDPSPIKTPISLKQLFLPNLLITLKSFKEAYSY